MKATVAGLLPCLLLSFAGIVPAQTKIAPREAEPGEPFTVIDAPTGRLGDGSLAVFRLGSLTVTLPLRTHGPFRTAHGRLGGDMYGGVYDVAVRLPAGVELALGQFTVIAAPPPPPLKVLYVLGASPDPGAHKIATGAIDSGGGLSFTAPITVTSGMADASASEFGLAASPDRNFLFVGHNVSNQVEAFRIMADGSLASSATAPVTTASDIEVHPTLPHIYVADMEPATQSSRIKVFEYSALGALSLVQTIPTSVELRGMAITSDGLFLLTTHIGFSLSRHVDLWAIDASGNLAPGPVDSETPVGIGRFADVVVASRAAAAFVMDLDTGIHAYSIVGGALTPLNAGVPYSVSGVFLFDLRVGGDALFALSRAASLAANSVDVFTIQATGELSPASSLGITPFSRTMAVAGEGSPLFVCTIDPGVQSYSVTASRTLLENAGSPFAIPGLLPIELPGRAIVVQR